MERKNYTVAIDLGSSNVVVAVGRRTDDGMLEVASLVNKVPDCVHKMRFPKPHAAVDIERVISL